MKYYKDNENNVYAYSEIQIPEEGLIAITEEEAMLIANPPPTEEQLATQIRFERDRLIAKEDWRFARYASEIRQGLTPSDDIEALDAYVQALRDIPTQEGFPNNIIWPILEQPHEN